jgi:hypothetical protein
VVLLVAIAAHSSAYAQPGPTGSGSCGKGDTLVVTQFGARCDG